MEPPLIDDETLDRAIDQLALKEGTIVQQVRHHLRRHANSFALAKDLNNKSPTVHQDVKRLNRIASAAQTILDELDDLHVQHLMMLHMAFPNYVVENSSLKLLMKDLAGLQQMTEAAGSAKPAKKSANHVLRHAVGGLMALQENFTGNRASIKHRNSDTGAEPELSSPEAKAILILLQASHPTLQTTTLVNVIKIIRRESVNGYPDKYTNQLILGENIHFHTAK